MILLTDDVLTLPVEQSAIFAADASIHLLHEGHRYGPFPLVEAIFYARRCANSSYPMLSLQRFERIHNTCQFKTSAVEFLQS